MIHRLTKRAPPTILMNNPSHQPTRTELESLFNERGIDFTHPGFYDDPAFKAAELENPLFLHNYADYVLSLKFGQSYLKSAQELIEEQVSFLYKRLIEDGRLGACIDITLTLSRFLERHGVWNYAVGGATSMVFSERTGLPRRSFETILTPENPAKCGHVWLYAPPFKIIDTTVKLQVYYDNASDYLPSPLYVTKTEPSSYELWELIERPMLNKFVQDNGREPILSDFPNIINAIEKYSSQKVILPDVTLNYIATGIFPSDGTLEEGTDLCLSGKYRKQLYEEYLEEFKRDGYKVSG